MTARRSASKQQSATQRQSRADEARRRRLSDVTANGFSLATYRSLFLLAALTVVLKSLIFAPASIWPLAFVCMVPWLLLIAGASHAPRVYVVSYVMATAFFLVNMRWLYVATGAGYVALSLYQACYFPFVAIVIRHASRRRHWPLAIVFPFVWVGSELLRAVVISGFPWFFLSHSQSSTLTLIQVSDLVGAYGVSFLIAAINGAVADFVLRRAGRGASASHSELPPHLAPVGPPQRTARIGLVFALAVLLTVVAYGRYRLATKATTGPLVAIIQGDFLNFVEGDRETTAEKMTAYLEMIDAAAEDKPDLIVLPESAWRMFLNPEARFASTISRRSFVALQGRSTNYGAHIVTGSSSIVRTPDDMIAKFRRYNSATVFHPDGSEPGQYNKHHLVWFGEAVPFRFGRLRFLYFWLNWIMPFSGPEGTVEYSFFPGDKFQRFSLDAPSVGGETFRFATPICYEDAMPYLSREFVGAGSDVKLVDFLVNISNDGWFGRGVQQPQHLAICVFRAVENRVGIARAVNTGISAMIDPNGTVHNVVVADAARRWPGKCGYSVGHVGVDNQFTLYSRYGDWFAWGCALVWLVIFVDYWIVRARTRDEPIPSAPRNGASA